MIVRDEYNVIYKKMKRKKHHLGMKRSVKAKKNISKIRAVLK